MPSSTIFQSLSITSMPHAPLTQTYKKSPFCYPFVIPSQVEEMSSSRFSRFELFHYSNFPQHSSSSPLCFSSPFFSSPPPCLDADDELHFTLDLPHPSPFDCYDVITDLIHLERTPFYTSSLRVQRRVDRAADLYLQSLSDRVSALELTFDRLSGEKRPSKKKIGERKYTCTAEIEEDEGVGRKYEWTAKIKDGRKKGTLEKNFKYTAEVKGKADDSPFTRTYSFKATSGGGDGDHTKSTEKEKEKKEKKKKSSKSVGSARLVEIQDSDDHGALVLKQAFAKRVEKVRRKRKELSPQDAAIMIQVSFRAYLIRRSQALRALRELAIAKSKLKEIRALFHNFSYRRQVSRDAEERQRFTEKIIVLLLTVDAISGADLMVRAAKKTMVDELEAMLDVVDPQPPGKSLHRRRTFDMPDAVIQKELTAGVAQVVRMLEEEPNDS